MALVSNGSQKHVGETGVTYANNDSHPRSKTHQDLSNALGSETHTVFNHSIILEQYQEYPTLEIYN